MGELKGTISKIHSMRTSRNGNSFKRVEFRLEDGSWAKTDLCPNYRNFDRWKRLLEVGTALKGLKLKSKSEIDADSFPELIKPQKTGRYVETPAGSMRWEEANIDDIEALKTGGAKQQKLIK